MSETELEQEQEPVEPDPEEPVDDDPDELPVDPDDPEQEDEPEPVQPSESEREIEALYTRLETKAKNYVKGMGELIEGSGIPVALCEMCSDAYPGIRWNEPRDELHATLLGVVGAAGGESPLLDDPDAELCDRCNGFGWTKLPAHVPGNTERMCRKCNGAGWLDRSGASGALVAPAPEPVNGQTEVMAGVPEDDPSVADLRARGYTIIPPIQLGAQEQPGGVPQP